MIAAILTFILGTLALFCFIGGREMSLQDSVAAFVMGEVVLALICFGIAT